MTKQDPWHTKLEVWNGRALDGDWLVTLKIDGVRAIYSGDGRWISRAGKPLYNIPKRGGGGRVAHLNGELAGKMIEVECMHLTPDRKFRHPRFIRMRPDKD